MIKRIIFIPIYLLILVSITVTGCSNKVITRSNLAFDTVVSVTLYGTENEEILTQVFDTINDYDKSLNAFTQDSVISSINRQSTKVDSEVFELLVKNRDLAITSGGDFNPLLGRLISLWDINEPIVKEPPNPEEIKTLLEHVSISGLVLDPVSQTVSVTDPEAELNLGASVKGFVADHLKEQLMEQGIKSALINLGGNILLIGDKNGKDFTIGIDDPNPDSDEPLGSLSIQNKSIVTSGNYQRFFTDAQGNTYHHILDPKTGYPVSNDLKEVVIVSNSSLEADLLSTAFFVMGKDKAVQYIRDNYDQENRPFAIFVTKDTIYMDKELINDFTLNPVYSEDYNIEEFTPY